MLAWVVAHASNRRHEDHAAGGHRRQRLGVVTGEGGEPFRRQPEVNRGPLDFVTDAWIQSSRLPAGDRRNRELDPMGFGVGTGAAQHGPLDRIQLAFIVRTELEGEPRKAGHDVEGARLHANIANGGDGSRKVANHDVLDAQDEFGCGDGGIPTGVHRQPTGVAPGTTQHQPKRAGPDDRRDHADADALALEVLPLLDVQLQVAGKRPGITTRLEQARLR